MTNLTAQVAPDTEREAFDRLQGAIMNLREPRTGIHSGITAAVAYKLGCRDIRHAATALVGEFAADRQAQQAAPEAPRVPMGAVRAEVAGMVPLTEKAALQLLQQSDLWDMHIHMGWYSDPKAAFRKHGLALVRDIEKAYGIVPVRA